MKKLITLIMLCFSLSVLFSCSGENAEEGYIYLPKTVIISEQQKSGFHREQKIKYKYDDYGNVVKEEMFTRQLFFVRDSCFDSFFTYDKAGNILTESRKEEYFTTNITDEHSISNYEYEYIYNEGRLIQKNRAYPSDYTVRDFLDFRGYDYEYDEYGNVVKELSVMTGNIPGTTVEYIYTIDEKLLENGKKSVVLPKEYNAPNQLVSMKRVKHSYTWDKPSVEEYSYQYDENGRVVYSRETAYDFSTQEVRCYFDNYYTYDKTGRLIKTEHYSVTTAGESFLTKVSKYKNFVKIPANKS